MRRLPVLKAIETFTAVAAYPSFSAAGEALGMTHGAISHQIRALESWLGRQVMIRHKDGVRLTKDGENLYRSCLEAFETLEVALTDIKERKDLKSISVGCSSSLLTYWILPKIDAFSKTDKEISFTFQTRGSIGTLLSRQIDVLITTERLVRVEGIFATQIGNDRIGPVCSPTWKNVPTEAEDFVNLPLLHATSREGAWTEWFSAVGTKLKPRQRQMFDTLSLSIEAASAGLGFAMAPEFIVVPMIEAGKLIAPLGFVEVERSTWICTRESSKRSSEVEKFRRFLVD